MIIFRCDHCGNEVDQLFEVQLVFQEIGDRGYEAGRRILRCAEVCDACKEEIATVLEAFARGEIVETRERNEEDVVGSDWCSGRIHASGWGVR